MVSLVHQGSCRAKLDIFSQLFLQLFGPSAFDDFTGALTKLRQTGTVREYQTEFEKLVKHIEGFSDAFYRICFIIGLKDTIRSEVNMFYPNTMMEILGLDKLAEDKIRAQQHPKIHFCSIQKYGFPKTSNPSNSYTHSYQAFVWSQGAGM